MKNKILVFRVILSLIIIVGLIFNFIGKNYNFNMFISYYTIQSNIIVLFILIFDIINHFKKEKLISNEKNYINIKAASTIIILITGLIFILILTPYVKNWTGPRLYSSYLLHYISPIMYFIDFLFFTKTKYKLNYKTAILWLIYPILYYVFGIIRILFLDGFIPYPFMNIKGLGFIKSTFVFWVLLASFYLLSLLISVIKNKIDKVN